MKVVKFGGSSLASGKSVKNALKIILADPERQVVVTSAPGKRFSDDIKVTDLLIKYANEVLKGKSNQETAETIFQRYVQIADYFGLGEEELAEIREKLFALPEAAYPNKNYLMAAFKAHGERLNAMLISKILQKRGVKARYVDPKDAGLLVTGTPNNAVVNPESYHLIANVPLAQDEILIFPGFYGYTPAGHIATFSRGGSDITGAILARAFHADIYENFTDVDAIFTVDPRVVANPEPIKDMTYREMRELSYAGFSVFHDEALIPAIQGQIPINVKNTQHPEKRGSFILPEKGFTPQRTITGIASGKHFAALYLHKYLINKEVGFTLRILNILAKFNLSYEHMPTGIDDLTIIFDRDHLNDALIDELCNAIQEEIDPDSLEWIDDYALIMIVGEGMRQQVGVISGITQAIASNGISVRMINQGASEISIMLGTAAKDADKTVAAIYDYFFNKDKE